MLVKNISKKIIHVNNVLILPDETKTFPESLKNNPVVTLFANMKLLEVTEQKQPKAKKPEPDPNPDETQNSTDEAAAQAADDSANQQNADDTEKKPAEKKGKAKTAK